MKTYSSSPELSSPPPSVSLSDPGSPSRLDHGRPSLALSAGDDKNIVGLAQQQRRQQQQQQQQQPPYAEGVALTKDGVPRKKPGRKPGVAPKPKPAAAPGDGAEVPKVQRRPRKPRDPNAPPIQRKRKIPPTSEGMADYPVGQRKITELTPMRMDIDSRPAAPATQPPFAEKIAAREAIPGSMQNILNAAPPTPPPPQASAPVRSSGQSYDPVRSSTYDPVRETMLARDPYGTGPLGSPRAPPPMTNRASASPSIASLVDPPVVTMRSPAAPTPTPAAPQVTPQAAYSASKSSSAAQPRLAEPTSLPSSPSNAIRSVSQAAVKSVTTEIKRPPPPPPAPAAKATEPAKRPAAPAASTTTTSSFKDVAMSGTIPAPTKKVASMVHQERKQQKTASSSSSPKASTVKDMPAVPDLPSGSGSRSILDFGKAKPGEETAAPSIALHIPLNGETNKYVNFMRLAEERYGWDALHPRLAAHRDRKARIAAATAALEKTGSGRESEDDMSVDLQSGDEASNGEGANGEGANGGGGTSGPDGAPAKPVRKKRIFKEDEYDKDDDFVDDSELMWEEQAAASRDGFFVYSGPLIPEVEKPAAGADGPAKRGRGGRGRGGSARGTTAGRGGTGRGGGPGSRGGSVARKPRGSKIDKQQLDRDKVERERIAQLASKTSSSTGYGLASGVNPPFSAGMVIDI